MGAELHCDNATGTAPPHPCYLERRVNVLAFLFEVAHAPLLLGASIQFGVRMGNKAFH